MSLSCPKEFSIIFQVTSVRCSSSDEMLYKGDVYISYSNDPPEFVFFKHLIQIDFWGQLRNDAGQIMIWVCELPAGENMFMVQEIL